MNWIRNKQQWRDYLLITLGTAVMAVATSSIYDPAGLVTGGFSGLAIVIKQLSQMLFGKGVPLWVTNLVLNPHEPRFSGENHLRNPDEYVLDCRSPGAAAGAG